MRKTLLFIVFSGISFVPVVFGGMSDFPRVRQTGEQSAAETMEYAAPAIGCTLSAQKSHTVSKQNHGNSDSQSNKASLAR